jgi:hypothetical protein
MAELSVMQNATIGHILKLQIKCSIVNAVPGAPMAIDFEKVL